MLAQEEMKNSGWRPGFVPRERVVAKEERGAQHGLQSWKLDSHRLIHLSSSVQIPPNNSTTGIELRLPLESWIGQVVCVSGEVRS